MQTWMLLYIKKSYMSISFMNITKVKSLYQFSGSGYVDMNKLPVLLNGLHVDTTE